MKPIHPWTCRLASSAERVWRGLPRSKRTWQTAEGFVRDSGLTPRGVTGGKRLLVVSREKCGNRPAMVLVVSRARKR